ncbi:hypothetical protein N9B82_00075 [Saprospiraceae bacterium]|nr:hypothetical protein [Saprospiraceae bacterium]
MPKKILLIVGGYSDKGVGEQFLQGMLRDYSVESIYRYSPVFAEHKFNEDLHGYKTKTEVVPFSGRPIKSSIYYRKFVKSNLFGCVEQVNKLIKEKEINLVWIVLNSYHTIEIGSSFIDKLDIPVVTHIWDTPEYLCKSLRFDYYARMALLKSFSNLMLKANRAVTVSKSMSTIYADKYKIDSFPIVFCPPKEANRSVKLRSENGGIIKVVFAGSLYAYREWNSFLDAVEYNNKTNEQKIEVVCIGNVSRWTRKRDWVKYEALKPIEEAATAVNDADVAYLPYWMSKKHAYTVKTAFPGKMSFYVASGTPVFFHGPKDSTPTEFLNEYKVGINCSSKKNDTILEGINYLISPEFQKEYQREQEKTMNEVFHSDRIVELFDETLRLALDSHKLN